MITHQQETITDLIPEMSSLVDAHWREVIGDHPWKPDPDWTRFKILDQMDMVRVVTVRDDGRLVGYLIVIVSYSLHYQTKKFAFDDAFFLLPSHQRGWTGVKLFREMIRLLQREGVDRFVVHEKLKRPMGKVLQFLEFSEKERIWFRDFT